MAIQEQDLVNVLPVHGDSGLVLSIPISEIPIPVSQEMSESDYESPEGGDMTRLDVPLLGSRRVAQAYEEVGCWFRPDDPYRNSVILLKEAKIEALKSLAKSLLDLDLMEIKVARETELQRTLDRDEEIELFENEIKKMREKADDPQVIIREEELESHLKGGLAVRERPPEQEDTQ